MNVKIRQYGENGILIDWPAVVDAHTLQIILNVNVAIQDTFSEVLIETVITYHTIAVYLKETASVSLCLKQLHAFVKTDMAKMDAVKRVIYIPVCYENHFALDMALVAEKNKLTSNEIIALHTASAYPICFLGFLPGFPYLAGLDKKLHTPRLETPRLRIAAGSVGIGGSQTGIYPSNSPGGWNIIGKTPLELFNVTKNPPNLLKAGDHIQFESITIVAFEKIKSEIKSGAFQLKFSSL
ncbi:MAG: inhibitor of KinA [Planctomycetota bacterium]|jgi:inhibitor of KinA|uniref:5-oxoprolinase subunit PxpB n=1 Tax=Patiriisocius sp. Uisw_047 TaxID=3230969 RepID=UPI0039ED4F09